MGYDCGHKSCDSHVCLTERLAQAERKLVTYKERERDLEQERDQAERERDDARAAAEFRLATVRALIAERDAVLAKAEAAEKDAKDFDAAWCRTELRAVKAEESLRDLRARIEALADEWDSEGEPTSELRALIQPPKAETPRERLIASMLRNGAITEQQRDLLLEQTPPPVPSSPACDRKS